MKRNFSLLVMVVLCFMLAGTGCSKDGVVLATYSDGKNNQELKIGDVKKELFSYIPYNPGIISNMDWHKDYLFDRYIASEIVYNDWINNKEAEAKEFQDMLSNEYLKADLIVLYRKGDQILNDEAKNGVLEVARASHILLTTSRFSNVVKPVITYTNSGKVRIPVTNMVSEQVQLGDKEFDELVKKREMEAANIIDTLKSSKNPEKEFVTTAAQVSEDAATAKKGGDVGYFSRGYMVKEFEDAVFEAKKKGLIERPVKTPYGIHIIYVTFVPQKKSIGQIEALMGKDEFKRMEPVYKGKHVDELKKTEIKDLFEINYSNKTIQANGNVYKIEELPDDIPIVNVSGKVETWNDCKSLVSLFVPNFVSSLNFDNFMLQLQNYKNFVFPVIRAKKSGYDKSSDYLKELKTTKENAARKLAGKFFEKDIIAKAESMVKPEDVKKRYNENKDRYMKDEKGKKVPIPLKEAEGMIKEEIKGELLRQLYGEWREEMKKKYNVKYNEQGINELFSLEGSEYVNMQKKTKPKR